MYENVWKHLKTCSSFDLTKTLGKIPNLHTAQQSTQ